MHRDVTPIFEYIAPTNKIVIEYAEPRLVLLAMRKNVEGVYFLSNSSPFEIVPQYGSVEGGLGEYITRAREMQGREGDIIRFADGHMLKIKTDEYVRIHKTKDIVRVDRNIVELVVNEQLDDVLPLLDTADLERVRTVERAFWAAFANCEGRLEGLDMLARSIYGGDKKRIALEMVPNLINGQDASFIFRMLDGKSIRSLLLEHCKKSIGSTPKYDVLMEWMQA
jgi:RNA ligase